MKYETWILILSAVNVNLTVFFAVNKLRMYEGFFGKFTDTGLLWLPPLADFMEVVAFLGLLSVLASQSTLGIVLLSVGTTFKLVIVVLWFLVLSGRI